MSTQIINDTILQTASSQDVTNLEVVSKYSLLESEQKMATLKSVFTQYFGSNYTVFIILSIMIILSLAVLISLF